MSTNKTTNYQFHLWEPGDDFLREEFNENHVKLDAALIAQSKELDAAVAALATEVDSAEKNAASALAAYKASNDAAVAGIIQTIAGHGNCEVVCGSYAGTGTYGSANPITLTFNHKPMLVAVMSNKATGSASCSFHMVRDSGIAYSYAEYSNSACTLTWTDTGVSWYNNSAATYQFNASGYTYYYVALLAADE